MSGGSGRIFPGKPPDLRIAAVSWIVLGGIYTLIIAVSPGSPAPPRPKIAPSRSDGAIIGSELIAQPFFRARIFLAGRRR